MSTKAIRHIEDMRLVMDGCHNHPIIYSVTGSYLDEESRRDAAPSYGFVAVNLTSKPESCSVAIYNRMGQSVTVDAPAIPSLIAALGQMYRQVNNPTWVERKLNPTDKI